MILVNSCGWSRHEPAHEYRWQYLEAPSADRGADIRAVTLLSQKRFEAGVGISDLVQSDSRLPSVVLLRDNGHVCLFVSRLPTRRTGSQGDPVYNGLLWVACEEDLPLLRLLAADVLLHTAAGELEADAGDPGRPGILEEELDRVVSFDQDFGFTIAAHQDLAERCWARVESLPVRPPATREDFSYRGKIGHNCHKLRWELAYELSHFSLPRSDGYLVVATGIKSEVVLRGAYVWRGLSSLVESVNWEPLAYDRRKQRVRDKQERERREATPWGIERAVAG